MAPKLQKAYPAAVSSKQALEGGLPASTSFKDHGKLKLSLLLSREDHLPWLAGETVKGWLELGISSTELGLGEVGVEFTGFEGESSREHGGRAQGSRRGSAGDVEDLVTASRATSEYPGKVHSSTK